MMGFAVFEKKEWKDGKMKRIKRLLTTLAVFIMVLLVWPVTVQAAQLEDNPKGTTLEAIAPGDTMGANYGTIKNNSGIVTDNRGIIENNNNTVWNNYGTVTKNENYILYNFGTVTENTERINKNFGTVTKNFRMIVFDYGTIVDNQGTVSKQYYPVTIVGDDTALIISDLTLVDGKYYIKKGDGKATIENRLGYRFQSAPTADNGTIEQVEEDKYILKDATGPVTLTVDMEPYIYITAQPKDMTFNFGSVSGGLEATGMRGGDIRPSFQWYTCENKNKTNAVPIDDNRETDYMYELPAELGRGRHYYFCRFSAPDADDVDTDVAEVTVLPLNADPDDCRITGITEGQEFTVGDVIRFEATGTGMDSQIPGQDATCYIPVSWSMNPSGTWTSAPYTASIDTARLSPGAKTLTVTFAEQRYENSSWADTGKSTTKSVAITLKAAPKKNTDTDQPTAAPTKAAAAAEPRKDTSPKTGDLSNIGLLIALMAAACVGIAAMVDYRYRSKKADDK